jgi:hypothetical protein
MKTQNFISIGNLSFDTQGLKSFKTSVSANTNGYWELNLKCFYHSNEKSYEENYTLKKLPILLSQDMIRKDILERIGSYKKIQQNLKKLLDANGGHIKIELYRDNLFKSKSFYSWDRLKKINFSYIKGNSKEKNIILIKTNEQRAIDNYLSFKGYVNHQPTVLAIRDKKVCEFFVCYKDINNQDSFLEMILLMEEKRKYLENSLLENNEEVKNPKEVLLKKEQEVQMFLKSNLNIKRSLDI